MTKTTLALAAALMVGSTMVTSAANAGGVRLGFGFPLGSFMAHSNQNYQEEAYRRQAQKEGMARRNNAEKAAAAAAARRAHAAKMEVAQETKSVAPVTRIAKLEDKLASDPATTTEIAKTSTTDTSTADTTTPDTTESSKVAAVKTTTSDSDPEQTKESPNDRNRVCRRFSAAIAGLVDVPCK